MSKILILHDTFLYRGGGERLVLLMAKALSADIASGCFSPGSYDLTEQGFEGKSITLMPKWCLSQLKWLPPRLAFIFRNALRHFGLKWAFFVKSRKILSQYDTIILSGDCISAVRHCKGKKVLYYCHTIPRYIFDQRATYAKKVPWWLYPIYWCVVEIFLRNYLRNLKKIPTIITNSKNTQARIRKYTDRDSEIIYPPVDMDFFSPGIKTSKSEEVKVKSEGSHNNIPPLLPHNSSLLTHQDYFLSFARLSAIKRVDRIVSAFQQMPDENLIITYGKNDPEKEIISTMIQGFVNISMVESPSDIELRQLIRGATATIYVPVDEDFGMSPVESMACGTPVIGVDDGGLKESIIDGKTGFLIDPACSPENIREAVKNIVKLKDVGEACLERAHDFSLSHFQEALEKHTYIPPSPTLFVWHTYGVPIILSDEYLRNVSSAVYEVTGKPQLGIINLITVDEQTMIDMNSTHRGILEPTDILTFSYLKDVKSADDTAGEIYLYLDKVRAYAYDRGNTYEEQLKYIVIHGTLHLLGYDHEDVSSQKSMGEIEDAIVDKLF